MARRCLWFPSCVPIVEHAQVRDSPCCESLSSSLRFVSSEEELFGCASRSRLILSLNCVVPLLKALQ